MKNIILVLMLFLASFAEAQSEFVLDEDHMALQLKNIDRAERIIIQYQEASKPINLNSPEISSVLHYYTAKDSSNSFTFNDIKFNAFALGFCCFPLGLLHAVFNPNPSRAEKISYCLGVSTIFLGATVIALIDAGAFDDLFETNIGCF